MRPARLLAVLALLAACRPASGGVVIGEYGPLPIGTSQPYGICLGPDGNVWFVEHNAQKIGRITPAGVVTEFTVTGLPYPWGICAGPDGNLWFTESGYAGNPTQGNIGVMSTAGVVLHQYSVTTANANPYAITTGPDGNLWFTERGNSAIGVITPAGTVTEYKLPALFASPTAIVPGPDGNLWFCEQGNDAIGRITTAGVMTEFPTTTPGSGPMGIAVGSDGALWFPENATNQIGRMTTAGTMTNEYPLAASSSPWFIASGADGNLWFSEYGTNSIGRITPGGNESDFPAPTGGSGPLGIALGSDGALWFTEQLGDRIGRAASRLAFHTLAPCRVLDTRNASGPLGGPALAAGQLRKFPFAGACGLPASAAAASTNVTITGGATSGDLRCFPADHPLPLASTINWSAGQTRGNNAVLGLSFDAQQTLSVQNDASGAVHVIIDVNGYFE